MNKPFWQSKTLWTNFLGVIASALNAQFGWLELDGETVAALFGVVNFILRAATKGKVTLS